MTRLMSTFFLLLAAALLAACSGAPRAIDPGKMTATPAAPVPAEANTIDKTEGAVTAPPPATDDAGVRINRRTDVPDDIEYPQLLPFDGIPPIYEPAFVGADEAPLQEDELVLAISLDGRAKAYPITVLRSREMVNDDLAGIPILVTW